MSWEEVSKENHEKNEYIKAYILTHFGNSIEDEAQAMSDALDAYYKYKGFNFGDDEESFILPDDLKK